MEFKNWSLNVARCLNNFLYTLLFGAALVSPSTVTAQVPSEKTVDYLERIYFSGENKEGLYTQVLLGLQDIQQKVPSPELAKQATFLIDIEDKINDAGNACEVLDLLSVGIYNINPAEALQQGVIAPTQRAKARLVDAVANLNKLDSSSKILSSRATNLGWSDYLLSRGKYGSFASGAGKVANTAGAIGQVDKTAGQADQTAKKLGDVGKSLGIHPKKDKPCDDVKKKEIRNGEHEAMSVKFDTNVNVNPTSIAIPSTSITVIDIQGISFAVLRELTDALRTKLDVQSAEKSYSEAVSTITVTHVGTTDALAAWLKDNYNSKVKLVNYTNGKITLVPNGK